MEEFTTQNKVLNYVFGLDIKLTKDKGRGIFAARDLCKGDLLVVEKAVAEAYQDNLQLHKGISINDSSYTSMMKQCQEIARGGGVEAIRLSYLYDGTNKDELEIPPIEVFVNNHYRKWQIPDMHIKQLI